jgi:hypothetical protein
MIVISEKFPPYMALSVEGRPLESGVPRCYNCPDNPSQASMFNINLDGPGPDSMRLGNGVAKICCRLDKIEGYSTDLKWDLIFERGK